MSEPAGRGLVVATAGHVDHGKSTLVRSLTGTDPDRLEEERRRGRSIVLGYAALPGSPSVSFVDVPGHRDHVGAALSGLAALGPAGVAVLVVAADDGWMPQTADHVAALAALQVPVGAVVVTRADQVGPRRVVELAADVSSRLDDAGCAPAEASWSTGEELAGQRPDGVGATVADPRRPGVAQRWPTLAVDARDRASVEPVTALLRRLARTGGGRGVGSAAPDLWVDRAFSPRGVGLVVTGTFSNGAVRVGDRLVDAASGAAVTVRGLQCHDAEVQHVAAPARVALRLRVDHGPDPGPGSRLRRAPTADDAFVPLVEPTDQLDVVLTVTSPSFPRDDGRGAWSLHAGTAGTSVAVRGLRPTSGTSLRAVPAELRLDDPLPLGPSDRLVVRDLSSGRVVGGGEVVDPCPPPRGRGRAARSQRSATLAAVGRAPGPGRPALLVEARGGWVDRPTAARLVRSSEDGRPGGAGGDAGSGSGVSRGRTAGTAVAHVGPGLVAVGDEVATAEAYAGLRSRALRVVERAGAHGATAAAIHAALSVAVRDIAREAGEVPPARARAILAEMVADGVLCCDGGRFVEDGGPAGRRHDELVQRGRSALDEAVRSAAGQGIALADVASLAGVPQRLADRVVDAGPWVAAEGRLVHHEVLAGAFPLLAALHAARGPFTVAEARDVLGGSRRTVVPLLAALDAVGATARRGDRRTVAWSRHDGRQHQPPS